MVADDMVALMPQMHNFARSLCRDAVRAADLVQEALLRALSNVERFQPGHEPEGVAVHDSAQRALFAAAPPEVRGGRRGHLALCLSRACCRTTMAKSSCAK